MTDAECVALLQWLLPRLRLRWPGFRRVRKQVCKRFSRRFAELGLADADAYRDYLRRHPEEIPVADYLCRVTISRFRRDRAVFDYLADEVIEALCTRARARGTSQVKAWSVGCASGEEPYTLALLWHVILRHRHAGMDFRILGTDVDETVLKRAQRASYPRGALKELPREWVEGAFNVVGDEYRLNPEITRYAAFARHDLRAGAPDGGFDLVLCRNLAFTYFDEAMQGVAAATLHGALRDGGALVLGKHETLPETASGFTVWSASHRIYRREGGLQRVPPSDD